MFNNPFILQGEKTWFVVFADFHGVNNSHHGHFQAIYMELVGGTWSALPVGSGSQHTTDFLKPILELKLRIDTRSLFMQWTGHSFASTILYLDLIVILFCYTWLHL